MKTKKALVYIVPLAICLLTAGCSKEISYSELQEKVLTEINWGFTFPGSCLYQGSDRRYSYFEICATGPAMGSLQDCRYYKVENYQMPRDFEFMPLTTDKRKWRPFSAGIGLEEEFRGRLFNPHDWLDPIETEGTMD